MACVLITLFLYSQIKFTITRFSVKKKNLMKIEFCIFPKSLNVCDQKSVNKSGEQIAEHTVFFTWTGKAGLNQKTLINVAKINF